MEIAIHKSLEHENIVKFVSTFDDETFIFIVLEYCQHRVSLCASIFAPRLCGVRSKLSIIRLIHENLSIIWRNIFLILRSSKFFLNFSVKIGLLLVRLNCNLGKMHTFNFFPEHFY